jgi:hypothetical protein
MNKAVEIPIVLFKIGFYVGLPALVIWGWIRWYRRTQPRTLLSILSLIGLVLATASAMLGVSSVLYAHAIGGFPYYDPRLLRIYRGGGLLSLSGIVFGIAGAWRPSPVRWLAPVCSVGTLLFWLASAMGE